MKLRRTRPLLFLSACLIALACTLQLVGCDTVPPSTDQFTEAIAEAREFSAELDGVIDEAQAELALLPEGPERDAVIEFIADRTADKAKADQVLEELEAKFENVGDDADAVDALAAALQTGSGFVPPPWSFYLATGGSVLFAINRWLKASRTQKAAESVVVSLEREKAKKRGVIDFEDPQTQTSLRSRMTPDAIDLVEQGRDKAGPIFIGLEPATS